MRANAPGAGGAADCGSVGEALRLAQAGLDYLNSPQASDMDAAAMGEVLTALGDLQGKLAAAHATFLRRFDAANAHDADGYGSSSAWLAAKGRMTRQDARAAVRQMRQFSQRPGLHDAVATGDLSRSWAEAIARWTRKLPAELRDEADKILLQAAAAGATLEDLATIAAAAIEQWRSARPDQEDDFDFRDRSVRLGLTFGGAGVIRGDLTPECAAALSAVLDALGKRRGPEDDRSERQRFHDALAEACHLLLRARMVPDRAGADTQVIAHIPISQLRQLPGAAELEDAWLRARLGDHGDPGTAYLTGTDAEVAACDALTVPVVTGRADMTAIDKMIALASAASGGDLSPDARQAHRYAIARLAVDFVSGPGGLASALRAGLLEHPFSTPSLPLDIGFSHSIPGHIRRAVILRDQHCAWPGGCDRPASDVHHIVHKKDGGQTSLPNLGLFCEFHHETCIHRWGWELTLHPDGTMEARSPDGRQVLRSHAAPGRCVTWTDPICGVLYDPACAYHPGVSRRQRADVASARGNARGSGHLHGRLAGAAGTAAGAAGNQPRAERRLDRACAVRGGGLGTSRVAGTGPIRDLDPGHARDQEHPHHGAGAAR
jgi:hypothetical protein